jgi:hypothetical protein
MNLSTHALEAIGFKRLPAGDLLEADFHSLHVFEARGFTPGNEPVVVRRGVAADIEYKIGVGSSINEVSKALLSDSSDFTKDEADWIRERKCAAPYLVIYIGPTKRHTISEGFVKNEDGEIVSYDNFAVARAELRELESKVLPLLEHSLACTLGSADTPVRLIPIETAVFGLTPEKVVVHDLRLTGHASLHVSQPIDVEKLGHDLDRAISLASELNPRASQFFQLGLRDQDELKRFLYYFLAIEIETHRVFRRVPIEAHLQNAGALESRTATAVEALLLAKHDNWRSLADRFVWCVVSAWTHLSNEDVKEFRRLKTIRDDIAHGTISRPTGRDVLAVEALAKKLHR